MNILKYKKKNAFSKRVSEMLVLN